jgi:hypothetical protein
MSTALSTFDASPSALGYLYQCRYALLESLKKAEDPTLCVSIEKLDDVSFHSQDPGCTLNPIQLLQLKHHIDRQGGTTDSSKDVWKTLRIWAIAVQTKKIDLDKAKLLLVTTSKAKKSHSISLLRPHPAERDVEKARIALESKGSKSTNKTIQTCYQTLNQLPVKTRKRLFQSIELIDGSPDSQTLRQSIERQLWAAVDRRFSVDFADRLEGWWFSLVIEHLSDSNHHGIPLNDLSSHVRHLSEKYRRDNLPSDFLDAEVPEEERAESDTRLFVRQLELIRIGRDRIRRAQECHYRAVAQRSHWIRSQLLDISELDDFELRLIDEFKEKAAVVHEGIDPQNGIDEFCAGQNLYNWSQVDATNYPALYLRPNLQLPYLTRGSFQMLADQLRVGWHPEYSTKLASSASAGGGS